MNFFIHSLNSFFKKLKKKPLHVAGFLQSGALNANIRHDPRSKCNQCKSEQSKRQWSLVIGGILRAQQPFLGTEYPGKILRLYKASRLA